MSNSNAMIKIVDLFSGVGGFSLGAARAGFRVALAIDRDKVMTDTYGKNFPNVNAQTKNLSGFPNRKILDEAGIAKKDRFGVIAGPPCQGMSCMGKMNPKDPRNRLFLKPFRFVREATPSFFVVETVPGALSDKYAPLLREALDLIPSKYVLVNNGGGILVRACECGAPTYRRRVFFAGYLPAHFSRSGIPDDFGIKRFQEDEFITSENALFGLPNSLEINGAEHCGEIRIRGGEKQGGFYLKTRGEIPDGVGNADAIKMRGRGRVSGMIPTRHSDKVVERYEALGPGERDEISKAVRLRKNKPGPTIRAGTGSDMGSFQAVRPIHYSEPRVITPREAARIQGFPDWFVFHQTKWHSFRQIGNSVSPIVGEKILREFSRRLNGNASP